MKAWLLVIFNIIGTASAAALLLQPGSFAHHALWFVALVIDASVLWWQVRLLEGGRS